MFLIDRKELRLRWDKVQRKMREEGADALLVSNNVNLYYMSGRVFGGFCYLSADGDPLFFVRRPVGLEGEGVVYIRKPEDIADYFAEKGIALPRKLMMETDSLTYNEYVRYEKIFTPAAVLNGTAALRHARSVKTEHELAQFRRSAALHSEVYSLIPSLYTPGMTDIELSVEIERQFRLHGSLGIFRVFGQSMEIFMGSVLAGDNADAPSPYDFALGGAGLDPSIPIGGDGTPLRDGTTVMVDMGGNFTPYMTDMTRVFSVGRLPDLALQAHACALDIERRIEAEARPGTEAKRLYEIAAETAAEAGLADYFMGHRQKAGFVGHGIGLEINESPVLAPRSRDVLTDGMVFALEPKFVIPGVGAVGIENSFAVRADGLEKLTLCEEDIVPLA